EAVAITPDGSRVYVANTWDNSISVIDSASNSVVATIGNLGNPNSLVFNASGSRLFVSGYGAVEVIDTQSNAQIGAAIPLVPASVPDYCPVATGAAAIDPAATRLYVPTVNGCAGANPFNEKGRIAVIDLQASAPLLPITVERYPTSATIDPAGTHVYVTN